MRTGGITFRSVIRGLSWRNRAQTGERCLTTLCTSQDWGKALKRGLGDELDVDGMDLLRLDNQLCFALYATTRAITSTYRHKLAPVGLTYPQYLVLLVLWEEDGITLSRIGERLQLDSGTLTPLLKRMEKLDLVRRQRSSEDEREIGIWLEAKGKELRDSVLDARKFVACRLGMSEDEIAALRTDLMEILQRLRSFTEQGEGESPEAEEHARPMPPQKV